MEHSDGTRITTYYDIVRTEIRAADAETGEEAEYESHVCKHVKVECEGFATVVMETEHGCARTLFGNGSSINTEANGECVVEKSDGSKLCFDIKGTLCCFALFCIVMYLGFQYPLQPRCFTANIRWSLKLVRLIGASKSN